MKILCLSGILGLMEPRYKWILVGGAGCVLVGGLFFWFFLAKKMTQTPDIFSEGSTEEFPQIPQGDFRAVLEAMPTILNFSDLAQGEFQADAEAELTLFDERMMQPLKELILFAEAVQVGLEQNKYQWCSIYHSLEGRYVLPAESSSEMVLAAYREQMESERSIRAEERLAKRYADWNMWLLRLAEAGVDKKKVKKSVEELQEDFNDITDAYDEALISERERMFQVIDKQILSYPERLSWSRALYSKLDLSLPEKAAVCAEGWAIDAGEVQQLKSRVISWRALLKQAAVDAEEMRSSIEQFSQGENVTFQKELVILNGELERAISQFHLRMKE